jgi:nucleoid-associated protein EbfC
MHQRNQSGYVDLAQRMREIKDGVARLSGDLGTVEATGLSGGGLVRATVGSDGTLVALDLDPTVVTPDDPGRLAALVIDAVNDAITALTAQRASQLVPIAEDMRDIIARLGGDRETTGEHRPARQPPNKQL